MKTATLQRGSSIDQGTFGTLTSGIKQWFSGELPWLNDLQDKSCIPAGTYVCKWLYSNHWKKNVYHVTNVPGRGNVEIHTGNFCGNVDLGWQSNVEGCIILGTSKGQLENKSGTIQAVVLNSCPAIADFEEYFAGEDFELTILNA